MKEACSENLDILSSGSSANVNYYSTIDFNGIMPVFPTGWFGLFFFNSGNVSGLSRVNVRGENTDFTYKCKISST